MSSSKLSPPQSQASRLPYNDVMSPALANDILNGFNVDFSSPSQDRDFLASLLTSGFAPPVEVRKLWEPSLMRGMEEWKMMMDCAHSLRDQAYRVLRLEREQDHGQSRVMGDPELCLLPFLGMIMAGREEGCLFDGDTCAGSLLGKRREGGGGEKSSAQVGRGGGKRVKKTTGVMGRGVSRFWAQDDTAKTSRQGTRGRGEIGVSDAVRKAMNGHEPISEGGKMALPTRVMSAVHRSAGPSQGERESKAKKSRLTDKTKLEHSKFPDEPSYAGTWSPQRSLASHSSPNENLDVALGDVSVAGTSSFDEYVLAANVRITGKRTYKSPFFSEPPPWPISTSKASPSKSKTSTSKSRSPTKKSRNPHPPGISCLPIAPLSTPRFGLIQEEVAADPFRLLIAVTFLIKVRGTMAIPLFRQLMDLFPTPEALASADPSEIINLIRPLGLSVNRCSVIQKYARMFIECPPCKEKRYGVRNYPRPGDARGVKVGKEFTGEPDDFHIGKASQAEFDDDDDRINAIKFAKEHAIGCAWEIGHLTQGPYALDSWRIFCRDKLLGRADDWKGKGRHPEFQPEWMRVLPQDKELRAYLRWMWMREGWEWDPITGEREPLREEMRKAVDEGRVVYDECVAVVGKHWWTQSPSTPRNRFHSLLSRLYLPQNHLSSDEGQMMRTFSNIRKAPALSGSD
ncbi:DNA glycosylase [Neurospora tetrasperma FGSC 2509]|nr:DNA glycosylase [Neurospora tetrasperma FGSC 2509]